MVERFHKTPTGVIAKSVESKGNWVSIVPMALYFVRRTPNSATGFSPFVARHGWEPTTPLQVLDKSWVQSDLGEMDLQDWVLSNAEKVQTLREPALVTKQTVSKARKQTWDRRAPKSGNSLKEMRSICVRQASIRNYVTVGKAFI